MTGLLRRRAKLAGQADVLFDQLREVNKDLQNLNTEIGCALFNASDSDNNSWSPPLLSVDRLKDIYQERVKDLFGISGAERTPLAEFVERENADITERLARPRRPKETLIEMNNRLGIPTKEEHPAVGSSNQFKNEVG